MIVKIILKFGGVYVILITVFSCLVILSCMIPSMYMKQNFGESISMLEKEGIYPSYGLPWRKIVLDNYTDSLMLNTAYSVDSSRFFWSAFTNYRYESMVKNTDQIANLQELYTTNARPQTGYERYWHGYLTYLRPLFVFFNLEEIRVIFILVHLSAFIWFVILSLKKLGKKLTLFFIAGFTAVDYFYLGYSLQFTPVFLTALFAAIYILRKSPEKRQLNLLLFFITGAATSFFDLLTAPLVTLGILLIIVTNFDKRIWNILLRSFFWSFGYLTLWFGKWFLAQLFFIPNAITIAYDQILNRTGAATEPGFSYISVIKLNLFQLIGYDKLDKIFVLIFGFVFLLFLIRYFNFDKRKIKNIFPWMIAGSIPYIWYLIAANHSYIHVWFTYRNQFMSVVCLFMIASGFVDWKRVNKDALKIRSCIPVFSKFTSKNHKH